MDEREREGGHALAMLADLAVGSFPGGQEGRQASQQQLASFPGGLAARSSFPGGQIPGGQVPGGQVPSGQVGHQASEQGLRSCPGNQEARQVSQVSEQGDAPQEEGSARQGGAKGHVSKRSSSGGGKQGGDQAVAACALGVSDR